MDTSVQFDTFIGQLLETLGISRAELAQALDVSERSIKRWQAGKSVPQYESRARMNELDVLAGRLMRAFPDAPAAHAWLRAPNDANDGRSLVDAIVIDRFDIVTDALDRRSSAASG